MIIEQTKISKLSKNDTITIEVEGQISPLVFMTDDINKKNHENVTLKYIEKGNSQIKQKYQLSFIIEEIKDDTKPFHIKDLAMKLIKPISENKEVKMVLYVNSLNKGKGKFLSKKIIRLGVPKIQVNRNTLIWPISSLISPEIIIDDTESNILSNNLDPIRIKLSKNKDFSDTSLVWDIKNNKDGYSIKNHILTKENPESKIIKISPHKFLGYKEFEDISSNGDNVYIAISFDGENYPIKKRNCINS